MPRDNVRDEDRELFERVHFETQRALIMRFVDEQLPNTYLETVIARMVAGRAATADCSIATLMVRVLEYAEAFESEHQEEHDAVRAAIRGMRSKETRH